ncbi:alpha carbonic anhydrase 4-like [Hibiscus syriacus]|uniref:alpha carbonic anhydrase 4-like n=1 Tax=Hibiscus syriacus TaxID=106335 RepID=UPI0019231B1B|nr:alpha carbonic anhydrase 4-like [Hibiscus syriacus]
MIYQIEPNFVLSFLIFSHVSLFHFTSISAQEVENEREFDYIEKSGKGPKFWGSLNKDWAACNKGRLQSPIDLSSARVKMISISEDLKRMYKPAEAIIKNRGHDILLQWTAKTAGSLKFNGAEYFLKQVHWHSPSEHAINGKRFAMELHMVHQCEDPKVKNNVTVIGQLYQFGPPNPFLYKLICNISAMSDKIMQRPMGVIDPNQIELKGNKFYNYIGSLTVPPCTEGVIWIIDEKIPSVSREQVHAIREAVHDYAEENARPLQPLNQREIAFFDPKPK